MRCDGGEGKKDDSDRDRDSDSDRGRERQGGRGDWETEDRGRGTARRPVFGFSVAATFSIIMINRQSRETMVTP
jgi:hypothetical protein